MSRPPPMLDRPMNLIIRLFFLYMGHMFAPKQAAYDATVERSFRVWLTDQDAFLHMNNARYTAITDLAGIDYMLRVGIWKTIRKQGWIPVIVFKDMAVHKMLKFPQKYTVRSRLACWTDKHICMTHEFWRGGNLHAEGTSILRFIGAKSGERPNLDAIAEKMGMTPTPISPPVPDHLIAPLRKLTQRHADRPLKAPLNAE